MSCLNLISQCRRHPIASGALRVGRSLWTVDGVLEFDGGALVLTGETVFRQRTYVVPRSAIVELSEEKPFWFMFAGGLRIQHTVEAYPPFVLWSRDIEMVTIRLRQLGFDVVEAKSKKWGRF